MYKDGGRSTEVPRPLYLNLFYCVLLPDLSGSANEVSVYISVAAELGSIYISISGFGTVDAGALYVLACDLDLLAVVKADVVDLILILVSRSECCGRSSTDPYNR